MLPDIQSGKDFRDAGHLNKLPFMTRGPAGLNMSANNRVYIFGEKMLRRHQSFIPDMICDLIVDLIYELFKDKTKNTKSVCRYTNLWCWYVSFRRSHY